MAFGFDLEAAVNAIATLEAAITTPLPGVTNSYTYGNNPTEITDDTALPAVVHTMLGPQTAAPGSTFSQISTGTFQLVYQVQSTLLILESVLDEYPGDESASNLFWKEVAEVFFNRTNWLSLTADSGAHTYFCTFPARSYEARPWPPLPTAKYYWSLEYVHNFVMAGAG